MQLIKNSKNPKIQKFKNSDKQLDFLMKDRE